MNSIKIQADEIRRDAENMKAEAIADKARAAAMYEDMQKRIFKFEKEYGVKMNADEKNPSNKKKRKDETITAPTTPQKEAA